MVEKHALPDGGEDRSRGSTVRPRVVEGTGTTSADSQSTVTASGTPAASVSAAGPAFPGHKPTKSQVLAAVKEWLDAYDDGRYAKSRSIRELQSTPKGAQAQPVRRLLRWTKVVTELCSIPKTDSTAPSAGRNVKLTQVMIAEYIARGADWVRDATKVREIVIANRDNEALRKSLRSWEQSQSVFGLRRFLDNCTRVVESGVPMLVGVAEDDDEDIPMYVPNAVMGDSEEIDDFERALLGAPGAAAIQS